MDLTTQHHETWLNLCSNVKIILLAIIMSKKIQVIDYTFQPLKAFIYRKVFTSNIK